jgi:hypothetical protein
VIGIVNPKYFWADGIHVQARPEDAAFGVFVETWGVKYDKTVACFTKDREDHAPGPSCPSRLSGHLDPHTGYQRHRHNVIESAFATVRHRSVRAKGCLSNKTALAMIFKLAEAPEKSWRRLDGHNRLPKSSSV